MTAPDRRTILSIDRGSSSVKAAVFELDAASERRVLEIELGGDAAVAGIVARVRERGLRLDAAGHRVVYGGPEHDAPARVSDAVLARLTGLVAFDPLHLPAALATIRDLAAALPDLPQVVCFDTAFHRSMPAVAHRLPLPRELAAEGIVRSGFHGLSYESIVAHLGVDGTRGRLIVAHLGNGASLAAIRDGRPVDTTMGFSPLGGIMMGTRPGDLDPGVLTYLLRTGRYDAGALEDLVTNRSGLLGVSGISADMRVLLERRATVPAAAEAIELFVYLAKKHIGALAAVFGGVESLVFTGGIGERSAVVRAEIAQGLGHLGIAVDAARNAAGAAVVSPDGAPVTVRVIVAEENRMVARHTYATLFA